MKETEIEKTVRENTPDFFVGTSFYVDKFHSYKLWNCPVHFKGKHVTKISSLDKQGCKVKKDFSKAMPDFILMNNQQMETLNDTLISASCGLPYKNPFLRKKGWYCEVFGDYWHGESYTEKSREEHELEVRQAYESGGNKVLILWENDILNHWKEKCLPMINNFIHDFQLENEISDRVFLYNNIYLSDLSLQCLNDPCVYRQLDDDSKQLVIKNLTDTYQTLPPRYNMELAKLDLKDWNEKVKKGIRKSGQTGNVLIDSFIRSRFDAKVKGHKSINELWKDRDLMEHCIDWQLMNEDGIHHANRFLNAMLYKSGFRLVNNLNQNHIYLRLKKYAVSNGIFFDPCAGWGGRMLAAQALDMKYIAIDANKKLVEELKSLANFIGYDAEIYYGDSSDRRFVDEVLKNRKIDLAFTCPPYFDTEIYSDDDRQSINMYPDKECWYQGFLSPMIKNIQHYLNGTFVLSCNEEVDLSKLDGLKISKIPCSDCATRGEDEYYLIENNVFGNKDYVKCEVCGVCMKTLTEHLKKKHGLTKQEYLDSYPESKISSELSIQAKINANKTKFGGVKRKYAKKVAYLMPDGDYSSKSDKYKRAWNTDIILPEHIIDASTINYIPDYAKQYNFGVDGIDYVTCAICGEKKKNLKQHIRKAHKLTPEQYKSKFNAEVYCEKVKDKFHQVALQKWRTQKNED